MGNMQNLTQLDDKEACPLAAAASFSWFDMPNFWKMASYAGLYYAISAMLAV